MTIPEISPTETKQKMDRKENFLLLDVREPWEFEICRIEGAKLIPLRTIPAQLQGLAAEKEIICYCHHGMRSLDVARWLQGQGIAGAKSMAGGIDRWSIEVDAAVPRY
jgi:rhodanese-related sulfurtransferase